MGRKPRHPEFTDALYRRWADQAGITPGNANGLFRILQWKDYQLTKRLCKPPWYERGKIPKACNSFTCPFCWARGVQRAIRHITRLPDAATVVVDLAAVPPDQHSVRRLDEILCLKNLHFVAYAVSVDASKTLRLKLSALCYGAQQVPQQSVEQHATYTLGRLTSVSEGLTAWLDTLYPPCINQHVQREAVEKLSELTPWLRLANPKTAFQPNPDIIF